MSRTSRKALRARSIMLLEIIYQRVDPATNSLVISLRELAALGGMSEARIRYAIRALKDEELLEVKVRTLDNGARLENAYVLTDRGLQAAQQVLELTRHLGQVNQLPVVEAMQAGQRESA